MHNHFSFPSPQPRLPILLVRRNTNFPSSTNKTNNIIISLLKAISPVK